jgi:hypothetical protein
VKIDIDRVREVGDPLQRAREAGTLINETQHAANVLGGIRREALEELIAGGASQAQLAAELGLTRARIGQIIKAGPAPERIFLGTGDLVVVVAGKVESNRPDPQPVVAQDDMAAIDQLAQLARPMGFEVSFEVSPSSGFVRLNRENLVVMCGPRLSPNIREVLESDEAISFGEDGEGWHLIDNHTGEKYRSPMDQGEPRDFAYLGRLPRPDGKGTFLYAAGIHAVGEAGVMHYLATSLGELYREVKTKRFSTIIAGSFDPKAATRRIVASERVTPLYRHEG